MKTKSFLILTVSFLAITILAVIADHGIEKHSAPVPQEQDPPHKPVSPEELEEKYRKIEREMRERDKRGIGHINPGDALTPPPGPLP
jgi:hypothetical protein